MTQILMTAAGRERLGERLDAVAPDADVVTIDDDRRLWRDGQPVDDGDVDPEIVWLSSDTFRNGTLGPLLRIILAEGSNVQWVQTFNAGLDNPAWASILERGVRLTKSRAQSVPIAEHVLANALSLLVPIDEQRRLQAAHEWTETSWREVSRTHWLLIGFGAIGELIATRVAAFEARLTVARRTVRPSPPADEVIGLDELARVLPDADVVVLACPSNDETRGLADEAFFAAMRPGAILVNIARGDLVDEDALRAGLDRSQPATAVLDVTATEPLPPDHWLWDHPQVRVSAHTSHAGTGSPERGAEQFLDNLGRYRRGEPLGNEAAPHEVGLPD